MAERVELPQGTLETLILKTLTWGTMHGFGIGRWIEQASGESLTIEEGSLYPALHRMEKRGWIEAEWRQTENNRRGKYYALTAAGRALNQWLFDETGVRMIYGYVLADNAPALMMNRQLGFGGWTRHPLTREERNGEVHLAIGEAGAPSPDGAYCYKIVLERPASAQAA